MNLASKIILGFLIVFSLVFFFLAMYTLDLRNWQRLAQQRQKQLVQTELETALLRNGDDANARDKLIALTKLAPEEKPGRKQLKFQLSNEVIARGRMWMGTAAPAANAPNSPLIFTVQQQTETPVPVTMTPNSTVFVFELPPVAGDEATNTPAGHYLGEFTVLENPAPDPAAGKFAIAPTNAMSPSEQKRLADALAAGMYWIAYEKMPQDRYGVFEGLTASQIEEKFPGVFSDEQKTEMELSGQDWISGKHSEDRKDALGKYRRPLFDYSVLLETAYRLRSQLNAKLAALQKDLDLMTAANEDVQQEIVYRQDEIKLLNEELARLNAETELVQGLLEIADSKLASVRATSARLEADNRRLVADLTAKQRQLVEANQLETASARP